MAAVIGVLAVVTLALTAFDNESAPAVSRPAPLPVTSAPPDPHILATVGNLRVQSPVAEGGVTAIGFHGSEDGALVVKPVGPQVNEGLVARLWRRITGASRSGLAWYQLSGGPLRTLDVGAVAGTDVYSPVDGAVVGITPYVLAGKHMGARVDIQPSGNPSLVVSLTHLRPDPNLTVGSTLAASTSKVGTILDFAKVEHQALARVTADAGNHVAIEIHPATLSLP